MDSETALELVKKGATLVLLDVPQSTLLGIDTQMFTVGPIFKGIKMIPPGPHFVHYSSPNRHSSEFSPVTGFFLSTCPSEVIVRKWDQQEERLVRVSEEEEERYNGAVKSLQLDHHLGPYAVNHFVDWKRLSSYITKSTIDRIEPIGGDITVAGELDLSEFVPRTTMEKAMVEQLRNSKFTQSSMKSNKQRCYYTPVPHVVKHTGISGEVLTSLNLDKTHLLETLLMKDYGGDEDLLLGELQFAFVAFLMGQSLEAFNQWKALNSLLFSCTEAPFSTRSHLFTKFIKVVYYQMKFGLQQDQASTSTGASFFLDDSWFTKGNFFHHLCKEFFLLVLEASVIDGDLLAWICASCMRIFFSLPVTNLKDLYHGYADHNGEPICHDFGSTSCERVHKTRKLRELLETTLGWEFQQNSAVCDFSNEDDEYAPVIEMLDDTNLSEAPLDV